MPIPLPNLDDRRWADLVEDGRAQIPRYAPQWTDQNIHDPGITLIELFAWLAEMTDYRLNRIPPRHKRKFLELLGFDTQVPIAARATLSFAPSAVTAPFVLPAGCEFEGTNLDLQVLPFRTLADITVSPTTLVAVQVDAGSGVLADRTHDFMDGFSMQLLGSDPHPNAAFLLGFDTLTASIPLSLGLRFAGPGNDAPERRRILAETGQEAAACVPIGTRLNCAPAAPAPAVTLPPHHSVQIVWEALTTAGWAAVADVEDDTHSLTLDGFVTLVPPATVTASVLGSVAAPLFYLRCRLVAGQFDAVPVLLDVAMNAVAAEQAIPVTQTFVIKAGVVATGVAPAPGDTVQLTMTLVDAGVVQSLAFGTGAGARVRVWAYTAAGVTAGSLTLDMELVGSASVLPHQQFALAHAPLDVSSLEIYTLSGANCQRWNARCDFNASTRIDFDFAVDAETGLVSFGNGERGQTPAAGALILARYRTNAASIGNLPPRSITKLRKSAVNDVLLSALPPATRSQLSAITTNRAAAVNGADAETLDHALGRAVEVLHAHERLLTLCADQRSVTLDQIPHPSVLELLPPTNAVNLIDLERIALSVPGTRVDRARAWSSLHPTYPCLDAPGVVTVVIVPEAPVAQPSPSAGLIERVWRYLNRRRTLCTNLQVIGPQYVQVTVSATVKARTGASAAKVAARVTETLNTFLNPLSGGPSSLGWPFGRSIYRSEIMQLIQDIPGVDHVLTLSMQADSGSAQCGDIPLCPTAMVRSGAHQIGVS
jgi:predicted phage baseplate assembly protein